jgi:hypothetical protein
MSTVPEPGRAPEAAPGGAPAPDVGSAPGSEPPGVPGTFGGVSARLLAPSAAALVFDDPLDRPSSDDTGPGWGDSYHAASDDDFVRFLNEKPPHHL